MTHEYELAPKSSNSPSPQVRTGNNQGGRNGGPDLVFVIALTLWDTLFLAKIYFALHVIYTKYTRGMGLKKRWILLLVVVIGLGAGPVMAFTALTSNHVVYLLGFVSVVCLLFPVLAFTVAILVWKLSKEGFPPPPLP